MCFRHFWKISLFFSCPWIDTFLSISYTERKRWRNFVNYEYNFSYLFFGGKGLSRFCIINALKEIDQKGISMHSFLMWKDGSLITEGYYAPIRQTDLHSNVSVTKALSASQSVCYRRKDDSLLMIQLSNFSLSMFPIQSSLIHGFVRWRFAICCQCEAVTRQPPMISSAQRPTG